jgi:hypothetical protein
LTVINYLGFRTVGYADDIIIIVQGKFAHTVRELMQQVLNVIVKWAEKEGLSISPHKTAIVPFTNKRILAGLGPLIINGKELEMLDEVVRRTCGRKWGLRPSMAHWLYTRVIRPSILYGVWSGSLRSYRKTQKSN